MQHRQRLGARVLRAAVRIPRARAIERACQLRVVASALCAVVMCSSVALAGQAPGPIAAPDVPISHRDRVYAAEQFSNTVSVTDPASGRVLGVIRLGEPQPINLSPLYRGQLLVHGLGFSPDHRTLAVVSIGSNSVTIVDTETNEVRRTVYLGRSPHEAFFTPDGRELWVTVRGEDYVAVLDARSYEPVTRIRVPPGPGMQIFSPDGGRAFVCSSFTAQTVVIDVARHRVVATVPQASPFCPNIAATPDGRQVWFTLKDTGRTQVMNAHPPFEVVRTIDTGPITNHVNFAVTPRGQFAYVTVGGEGVVKVFRTTDFARVAEIPVGRLPHGCWPSGDGRRIYVGVENDDALVAIDTATNTVSARLAIGQAPQAVVYVPNAVPRGTGTARLAPLATAANVDRLLLVPASRGSSRSRPSPATTVALYDQGLTQVLQAAVVGLEPGARYVLALAGRRDGGGRRDVLAEFTTNPAGSAIVNAVGPIRQIVGSDAVAARRYLIVAARDAARGAPPLQVQAPPDGANR